MKYRNYFESNFYKKREELQKAMQSPQEVNVPVGGVATSTSPLNLQTPQPTPQVTPQITPQITPQVTPQTTPSPFPTLEEMTTTPTGLTAKEAVEKSVNFFDNIKNNLVELKDKIIRGYIQPLKLTLADKELRKKNIYETASAGLTQLREHPLETIIEGAKPGVRAVLKTYGLGLLDSLADSEIFDIKNQQLAESEKAAEKVAEIISYIGLYASFGGIYTGAAQKIIPEVLLKLRPTLNPETVSFLTSQMIKSGTVARGLIDLGAWMTTDLMNANNFKLTEEEKQQGKNVFDKLLENSALSIATWGLFKAGEFVIMKGLINPIVKPSLDLFDKTFKKITNDVKDTIYFRRVNKIFDEASKVAKEIETPEIKTEIKPEVKTEVKPEAKPEVKQEISTIQKPEIPEKTITGAKTLTTSLGRKIVISPKNQELFNNIIDEIRSNKKIKSKHDFLLHLDFDDIHNSIISNFATPEFNELDTQWGERYMKLHDLAIEQEVNKVISDYPVIKKVLDKTPIYEQQLENTIDYEEENKLVSDWWNSFSPEERKQLDDFMRKYNVEIYNLRHLKEDSLKAYMSNSSDFYKRFDELLHNDKLLGDISTKKFDEEQDILSTFYDYAKGTKGVAKETKPNSKSEKILEIQSEVKPEVKPNLGKASVLEKEIKTIESDLSVADKVNFEKFFDEVKNKGIIAGNTLRKKLGGEVFTTDINKTINEIAEQFKYELGEKEKISSLIQEGGLEEEGISKLSGFHIIERAPAKEVKVDYAKQLEKALLQYNPQYSKKEINELVIKRYGKSLKEIAEAIKAGKTLAELNVVPEFSEAEINRLREVFDRFAQSKGTLNDFISAIYGKDISKLSKGDRLTAYKKAIEFSNLYQFKDYKEMYESLLKSNPELADTVGYEFKKGKPQKTKTTIRDTIDSAKEKIEDVKDKNILSYVRENIKANPDYTYADFIKDVSAKEYGKILSEADIERMEDNGTWRTFITELDKKLKEKYKKTSAELFTSFIQEAIEASEKMPENEMLNTAIRISTTADIEKSATPIIDQVIREQSVEANAEIAKEMQKGALVLDLDKESVMTANEYIDKMFQQQEEAKKSIKEKVIEGLKDVNKMVRKLSGEFEVDDVLNKYFPKFINDEITFRAKILKIQGDAFLAIRNVIQPLGKLEKELFNRIVALNDLWVTSMQGKETPLSGKATIQEIEETLKSLYQLARTRYPKVITAVRKHFELMRAVRMEMENFYGRTIDFSSGIDENIAKEMTNKLRVWSTIPNVELGDTYFHHKVLDYVNYKYSNSSWIPKEIKKEFNQYTMKRGGSVRDISTDYENVVKEYLIKTKHIFEIDKFYEDSVKKYNLLNLVNNLDTVNEKFFKPTEWRHGEIVPDDMIPESIKQEYPDVKWRAYGYERGRTIFPVKSVNEEMLAEAIEDGLTVEELMELRGPRGGLPIRDMLALGRRKATIILPEQIYWRLSKYRDANSKELGQLLSLVIKYTRLFKPFITKWYGGIAWRIANSVGDYSNLAFYHPESLLKVPQAIKTAYELSKKSPEEYSELTKKLVNDLKENGVLSSSFITGEMNVPTRLLVKSKLNPLSWLSVTFDKFSSGAEVAPKIASILDNLERIEKGKPLILRGADPYILQMAKMGYAKEATYAFGRAVTVDYAAMPDSFKIVFSEFLAPFAYWFARTSAATIRTVYRHPLYSAVAYLAPIAGIYIWNNLPQNKKIWDSLPEESKVGLPIILGQTEKGKAIIFRILRPQDIVGMIFGVDKLINNVESVVKGKLTPEEAAKITLSEMISAPPRFFLSRLLNPLFSVFNGIVMNKDPYTNKNIVPEKFVGSEKAIEFQLQYIAEKLLPPIMQMYYTEAEQDFKENTTEWLAEVLGKPFRIDKQFIKEWDPTALFENSIRQNADRLEKRRNVFIEKFDDAVMNSIKTGNFKEMDKVFEELNEGIEKEDPPVDPNYLFQHFITNKNIWIKFFTMVLKQAPTQEQKDSIKQMINILQTFQVWESIPKELRQKVLDSVMK